jgi:Fic-DOC domain mobile mystery protein B
VIDQRSLDGPPDDGQTPLDPDEAAGLIPAWIATRGDLNEAEAANIRQAYAWADRTLRSGMPVASHEFLRGLHRAMFDAVWRWAGTYRATERSIGIAPHEIAAELHKLFEDTVAWRQFGSYDRNEQAVRLHHRLTWIHPFPNGNGRASRLAADYYRVQLGGTPFGWGQSLGPDEARTAYLDALRSADAGNLAPLLAFAPR